MTGLLTSDDADQLRDLADRCERAGGTARHCAQANPAPLSGLLLELSQRTLAAAATATAIADLVDSAGDDGPEEL
jgi:hypothetical protein